MSEQPPHSALVRKEGLAKPEAVSPTRLRPARSIPHDSHTSSVNRNDILYALFKHKKKIILGALIGLAAAAAVFFFYPATYESDAMLMVRYLVERSTVDSVDTPKNPGDYTPATEAVMNSETAILKSWDLAVETAEAIGPKRLLPHYKGTPTKETAATTISSGLVVTPEKGSNILFVSYQNANPELATLVLNELVNRYFNKHLEVHRSAGAFDFVTEQTDQVRARLNQTEDALKDLKEKAGIISLNDATTALDAESQRVEEQLHLAEAEYAEQRALVQQLNGTVGGATINPGESPTPEPTASAQNTASGKSGSAASPAAPAPLEIVQKYQGLVSGLQKLRQTQIELFTKYTPESEMVKANQAEMDDVDRQVRKLEKQYPDLPSKAGPIGASNGGPLSPAAESARLAGLRAKRDALAARLNEIRQRVKQLGQVAPQIGDLERQKQLQEDSYKYFEATLEKARVDEALDPSKIPNISAVQHPSPPILVTKTRNKIAIGAAVGGFAAAVAFVLLKELVLSRKVRRPIEIERFVGINPLMAIPYTSKPDQPAGCDDKGEIIAPDSGNGRNLAPWDLGHFIRPYTEAIRDRLGLYFELHNLTHKPKLVGVAGFSNGAGTSTLAAGLAAALSETNDGKVLLVDVSLGPDQVHPFFRGKPAYTLKTALIPNGAMNAAAENLYLAKVGSPNAGPAQLGLKKFFDLMPNLKASDFDYVIFDMPPLHQTSPTWGMAPFMDKMLLVVEAEENSRDAVKRSCKKLVAERDNLSLVLNKLRSYSPRRFELED